MPSLLHHSSLEYATDALPIALSTPPDVSHYWRALMLANAMPELASVLAPLIRGHWPADEAQFGESLSRAKAASERAKELVFEEVRAELFPHAPSRSRCLFGVDGDGDVEQHMRQMKFDPTARATYQVDVAADARVLRVDSSLLDCTGKSATEQREYAKRYWSGTTAVSNAVEVLVEGSYHIVRIVRPKTPAGS